MKKTIIIMLCALLALCLLVGISFYTAIPHEKGPVEEELLVEPFQVETNIVETGQESRLEKTYYLKPTDNPMEIPTEPIMWNQHKYLFMELKETRPQHRLHRQTMTMDSATNNLADILKQLEPTKVILTEDGYHGTITLDPASIAVSAKGYQSKNKTVSATRTYPNLSDADASLIPKSITENGKTLTLQDINWQNAASDQLDGYELAMRYTAVATYRTTIRNQVATGYVVTAEYVGELTEQQRVYTAIFTKAEQPDVEAMDSVSMVTIYLLILGTLCCGAVLVYYGGKEYEHYLNRKRGYEE